MKQIVLQSNLNILHMLENIEKDVMDLKLSLLKNLSPARKKLISFKGIIKDVDITDEDIIIAKKSIYSKIRI